MTSEVPGDNTSAESAAGSPEEAQAMLTSLASSVALLPQTPRGEGEPERPEGSISLPVIEHEGKQFVAVFTNEEALREAGADPSTALRIPIVELAANWPSDDLWLAVNPASEQGLGLPPDVVRSLPIYAAAAAAAGNGRAATGDGDTT
ncbi:MAG: hypothetical protein JWP14_1750 [Frankiales bacterium]|jgi:hypothetical protein|nr:hypothetical protein [Frankiales bacterium]